MKESIINNKIVTLVVGVLFLGGLAAMLGMYRAAKDPEITPWFV